MNQLSMAAESAEEISTHRVRPWYRGVLFSVFRVALIAYAVVVVLLVAMENRLVYMPPTHRDSRAEAKSLGAEEVWFQADDGTKLHGWLFPRENAKHAIVYFHGNGEDADHNLEWAAELRDRLQATVFVFDYRGYGHSEGHPYETGVISDGIAAQRWLADRLKLDTADIVLYGRSLGGGVAVAAAEQLGARAIIAHGTFANMVDVAAAQYAFVPVRALMRNSFLSEQRISHYSGPLLQIHGTHDTIVPIKFARPLYEAAPGKIKRFVEIADGEHNDPLPEFCYGVLAEFLDSLPALPSAEKPATGNPIEARP
jgi:fermentation-respiration switch protein FrsA (DUF1100 family)